MIKTALSSYDELIREEYLDNSAADFTVHQLGGHGINSVNYKLDFPGMDYQPLHLKILHQWDNHLSDKLSIFDRCRRAGVKTTRLVKTKNGEYFVDGQDFVAVCFHYYGGQPYTGNSDERIAAAQELGKLNTVLSKFDITIPRSSLYNPLTEQEIGLIKQKCEGADEFRNMVSENLEWLSKCSKELSVKFTSGNNSRRLEHIDYHPDNVLINDGRVAAIVDFDSICSVSANQSVAFASDRFSGNAREMAEFIQAYLQTGPALRVEQIKRIPALIQWEALQRINYILRSSFFKDNSDWNGVFSRHINIIKKTISAEAEFIDLMGI